MAAEYVDLVLFPHCDLHVVLTGAPALRVSVHARTFDPMHPAQYNLVNITGEFTFDFFAPHQPTGHRFEGLPKVDRNTGLVTATTPGVFLFQARRAHDYIVGRLQVHREIKAWWFGNDSITTALDVGTTTHPGIAHAQPSIYAKFSADASGADEIGDITGHGYVRLAPDDPTKLAITAQGRVRGLVETDPARPTGISGSGLGHTAQLPVRVFDYAKPRPDLYPVQTPNVARAADMHNMVFVSEGFLDNDADRRRFDEIVTRTVQEMFSKPRHEPYAMLEGSFNIFKAFVPSQQHRLTCGFRVTEGDLDDAVPIPFNARRMAGESLTYTIQELVAKVGLPMHNESRPDLVGIWSGQSLTDFEPSRVDLPLLVTWRLQDATGILHAQDTIFGFYLGSRPADRSSGVADAVAPPTRDEPGEALRQFVARIYEFYDFRSTRSLTPDPRRHPPELYARGANNPTGSIVQYLGGLKYAWEPNHAVGRHWVPNRVMRDHSQGLVAIIAYDDLKGGGTIDPVTAQTAAREETLAVKYDDPLDKRVLRRLDPELRSNVDLIASTITHEFGHSLNLADEYEDFEGDGDYATRQTDAVEDNVTVLGFVRVTGTTDRSIDPAKVKWLRLPRMSLSAALLLPSVADLNGIRVTIEPRYIGKWAQAKKDGVEVHLRNFVMDVNGRQLPLSEGAGQLVTGLSIGDINESRGTLVLVGPPFGLLTYAPGSVIYVPLRDGTRPLEAVDQKVQQWLAANHKPMNRDDDHVHVRKEYDVPVDIPGFVPPCDASRTVGVFEGAWNAAGAAYRPAGACKMRYGLATLGLVSEVIEEGAFCYVCKWLIVNRIDPSYHAMISGFVYPGKI
jgi:IgA Peptidase M64